MAVDPAGLLYVTDGSSIGTIRVFSATAYGNVTPIRKITGSNTQLFYPFGLGLDSSNNIYVTTLPDTLYPIPRTSQILVFSPTADSNAAPIRTISTNVEYIHAMAVDACGNVFAAAWTPGVQVPEIFEYAAGASESATPIATIVGSNTQLFRPSILQIDPAGNLYVMDVSSSGPYDTILVFGPTASGNVMPTVQITPLSLATYGIAVQ
jgi:hypothetical protein